MNSKKSSVKSEVKALKARLEAYSQVDREIENQTELLERLTSKLESAGVQELTGMPRSGSQSLDRLGDLISQKLEIAEEIQEAVQSHKEERQQITKAIRKLKSADERAVIRFRYFAGLSWGDVNVSLFGAKDDFLEKENSYLRRSFDLHGKALLHMLPYIERKMAD